MGEQTPPTKLVPTAEQRALSDRIIHWEQVFADVPAGPHFDSADELRAIAAEDLNYLMGETDELALFSAGKGLLMRSNGIHEPVLEETISEGGIGLRQGFEIVRRGPPNAASWRVAHHLLTIEQNEDGQDVQGILYLYALGSVVTSLSDVELRFYEAIEAHEFPLLTALTKISEEVASVLGSPDFLEEDLESQRFYVDTFIEEAEQPARALGPIVDQPLTALADQAYALEKVQARVEYQPVPVESNVDSLIRGECLGLTILCKRQLDAGLAVRKPVELVCAESLCIVVNPDKDTSERLGLLPEKLLYLPITEDLYVAFDAEVADRKSIDGS